MDRFDIQKLRDLPIEGVAERLGLNVQKHKAVCPFHDDRHPSLTFHLRTNTYHCFACSAHGSGIDLAMRILGVEFKEACRWLADEHNIILSTMEEKPVTMKETRPIRLDREWLNSLVKNPVLNEEAQRFLFAERKFNKAVVKWLGISSISSPVPCWRYGRPYFDAPSLLIPYKDINGNVVSVQSRYLGNCKETPRFRFPKGGKCGIFNLPVLKGLKNGEELWITEGVTDCIAMLSSGRKAIAIPSATLLKAADIEVLQHLSAQVQRLNLHMYPDADIPGEKLYIELVSLANKLGACLQRHRLPEGCKDFSEYWTQKQKS